MPFGQLLKHYRTEARLTQEALAERAGVSTRSVRALEHGGGQPQRDTAQRLANALALEGDARACFLAAAAPAPRKSHSAPAPAAPAGRAVMPLPPTTLVGRSEEIAAVAGLLRREEMHLVTLTGPGGIGKTRLALQAAQAVAAEFADGVTFVPLAPLTDTRLVLPTLAAAFGLREGGAQPILLTLANHLRGRRLLLVLDNFEHLLEAATDIAALQRQAPPIKLLVTSQMPLRLQGEQLYPVPPLALPLPEQAAADVSKAESVRLFVQRAALVKPDFTLDAGNTAAVAAITCLLDGLPLAIELAAARTAVLSPPALLERLAHPLQVLTGGPRDLPPRHQTLRGTIAWSYALLTPPEQALLRRLAVCAGGCLPEAAAAIAGGDLESTDTTVELLIALAEKNMLQTAEQPNGRTRFTPLETIREYGCEQLAAAGETAVMHRRHAAWYLAFAERAAEHLQGADQLAWLHDLDCELANLRAALAWQPPDDADALLEDKLRVTGKLFLYWHLRGRYTEGVTWLNGLLAQPGAEGPTAGRAWALSALATLKASQGDNTTVYAQANAALALARQLDDPPTLANALHVLGTLDVALSPPNALVQENGLTHLAEAVQLRREGGDQAGTALSADYLGFRLLRNGDYTGALPHFREGLKLGQSLPDHWTTGMALLGMAEATFLLGDVAGAQALALRSLEHHAALDDGHGSGHVLGLLGDLAAATGDFPAAYEYYDKSIRALQAMGEAPRNVRTLWALAPLIAASGDAMRAVQLAAAAVALSQTVLVLPYSAEDERLAPVWALAEQALSPTERSAAWAAGQTLTLEAALALAIEG